MDNNAIKKVNALTQEIYNKLVTALVPADDLDTEEGGRFLQVLAGQSAYMSLLKNNFIYLMKANIIPADLGRVLILQAEGLTKDLERAVSAAAILRSETCDCPPCTEARKARGGPGNVTTIPAAKDMH